MHRRRQTANKDNEAARSQWIRFTVTSIKAYKLAKEANHDRRRRRFGTCIWIPIYVFIFYTDTHSVMCGFKFIVCFFPLGRQRILWYWCAHFQFDITICSPLNMVHQSKNDFRKHAVKQTTDTAEKIKKKIRVRVSCRGPRTRSAHWETESHRFNRMTNKRTISKSQRIQFYRINERRWKVKRLIERKHKIKSTPQIDISKKKRKKHETKKISDGMKSKESR